MVQRRLLPLACIVLPLLWSCGPRQTELVKVVDWSVDESLSWKGGTREELVADLGRPNDIESDGKGGEVYSYSEFNVSDGVKYSWLPAAIEALNYALGGSGSVPSSTPVVVETHVLGKFWIDENRVVYQQWINPELLEKRPPP